MSQFAATFSGCRGDILWSLPTVRALAELHGTPLDFYCMPQYESLIPFIKAQSYVDNAMVLQGWQCEGSPHGDQPWFPQVRIEHSYSKVWHLTYRSHPGIGGKALPLVDFIADQQELQFTGRYGSPLPFVDLDPNKLPGGEYYCAQALWGQKRPYITYAYNPSMHDRKAVFHHYLRKQISSEIPFIAVDEMPWTDAALFIATSIAFVGCRSANYALAHGTAQRVICYDPHPGRCAEGRFGEIFGCPYGRELSLPALSQTPEFCANVAAATLQKWLTESEDVVEVRKTNGEIRQGVQL